MSPGLAESVPGPVVIQVVYNFGNPVIWFSSWKYWKFPGI